MIINKSFSFFLKLIVLVCIQPTYAQIVNFSNNDVFHQSAFYLTLSPSVTGMKVYYTLNGSRPTKNNAKLYTSPINITTTTPVSAACIDGDSVCQIFTKTYIFLNDVYKQSSSPTGYPMQWSKKDAKSYYAADYGMDTKITQGTEYKNLMDSAMKAIPTVCIVTDINNLFSHSENPDSGGIYIFTGKDFSKLGDGWERPASIEYYDPKTKGSFQLNCGLLLHGGNSRNPQNSPKHSFRVSFRKQYGAGKLKYKLFEDADAVKKFDHLILRAGYNYTWIKNGSTKLYPQNIIQRTNAQYILDSWAKEVQHSMGDLFTHRRFCHLYLNGLYWGLYELCEKINNNFAQAYLGGEEEDYDVVDVAEMIDGTRDVYTKMYTTATSVDSTENDINYLKLTTDTLLDLENYLDYMLINWYIGNDDWDNNNWRCIRNRVNAKDGFKYLVWDAETAFTDVAYNKVVKSNGNPTKIMAALKKNPKFKALAQKVIEKHLTGDGILTPEKASALYKKIADEIDLPIICESARWGDYRIMTGETNVTYTRNNHWLPRKQDLLNNYFPKRTSNLLSQLDSFGLYDSTGIQEVYDGSCKNNDSRIYDIQGRYVGNNTERSTLKPGIYIQNGKKFLITQ